MAKTAQFMGGSGFGKLPFGGGQAKVANFVPGKRIAIVGDISTHGGTITDAGTNAFAKCRGVLIAVEGASHSCPVPFHGVTAITAVVVKTFINGKKVVTYGATAGCGAIITPPARGVTIEQ